MRLKRRGRRHLAGWIILALFLLLQLAVAANVFARAGGGGSSSDSSSSSSSDRSSSRDDDDRGSSLGSGGSVRIEGWMVIPMLVLIPALTFFLYKAMQKAERLRKEKEKALTAALTAAASTDPAWQPNDIEKRAVEVFHAFQKAWSEWDTETMKGLLTQEYFKRMVLELSVLKNMGRRNVMENLNLMPPRIIDMVDDPDNAKDSVTLDMWASAKDTILDTASNTPLHVTASAFREYWTFRREDGMWKLGIIKQMTESARMVEWAISNFAERNGFYYDPDFGWLMMPDKGVLFGKFGFGKADINNHVIGYYRDKIVEFYTYIPNSSDKNPTNYLVAQAILPISYHDVLIRKKSKSLLFGPSKPAGLNQMTLEFGDFNEKFEVFAHPEDRINSLELLTPNFMVKIFDLPFELNIELVGNVLYLYTSKRDVSYDQMLEVLSWAFDDMKK